MKKLIATALIAVAALFSNSCDFDINVSVEANAELIDAGFNVIYSSPAARFGPYSHYYLTDLELEDIFLHLIKGIDANFTSAVLYLNYYDNVTGQSVRSEEYGVLYSSKTGRYEFDKITYL